ncbi:MAG: restriction endonuclease [Phycisphaeraceae bacterium]|nr:restriction endonuclease [Phycisphaeraceae bacterium]
MGNKATRKLTTPEKAAAPTAAKPAPAVTHGRPSALLDTRVIYCGDNLEQLAKLPDTCIDLIYIDPPFNSNRNYEVFWGETKEKRSFEDRHASTQAYIDYMRPRCVELARVLKRTGSFYYHCDWHASHYVKVMLDQLFGETNFHNEIVWKRNTAHSNAKQGAKEYGHVHDVLFYYTGGAENWTFNTQYVRYSDEYIESHYRYIEEGTGRRYRKGDLTANKGGGDTEYEWTGPNGRKVRPYAGRYWAYSKSKMLDFERQGRLVYTSTGMPEYKRYLDEMPGQALGDVWDDIDPINSQAQERLGYPTQKPLALLDRIIQTHSNPNDIVLDAFCGCGTALVAAQILGRQWIGIDISPTACRVMAKRLRDVCRMRESEPGHRAHDPNSFIVRDLPWTIDKLKAIPPFEFENWAVIGLGGIPNKVQVGDMGIDGRIFPVGTKPSDANSMFAGDWFPIQVKQIERVGRPDIDAFEAVMEREDRQRGFFVAFSFSSDAASECAAYHKRSGRIIKLITVQEILDRDHVQKM